MYGYGYGLGGSILPYNGDLLSNALANHFYYDKLVVANGGIEDFHTYYGVSLATFKTTINTVFTDLDSAGLTSKVKRWTPRIGSIGATQRLNAISVSTDYDGTFTGGTFSTDGVFYDGTDDYESTAFTGQNFTAVTDFGFSFWIVSENFTGGGTDMVFSNYPAVASFYVYIDGLDRYLGYMNSVNYVGGVVGTGFYTFTRTGATMTLYRNGVLVDTAMASDSLAFSADVINIARYNTTYSEFTENNMMFHDALDATECLALYNAINTMNTALGR